MSSVANIVDCARHPGVETALRCQRCEAPICPRCMIQSPVGAKCPGCAKVMRSPIYTLNPVQFARAAGAALIGGVITGIIWGLILVPFTIGFLSIFVGAGLGYLFTRLLEWSSGRKRGLMMVTLATLGILIAWAITVPMVGLGVARYGLVAAGIGVFFSYQNLK
jgi:hypothetical protein